MICNETYFDSIQEAGVEIRRQLIARENLPTVIYRMQEEDYEEGLPETIKREILSEAESHTGKPNEGDYLKRSYYEITPDKIELKQIERQCGYLYFRFLCRPRFKDDTSAQCEKEIDQKIREIKETLELTGKSEYEKVKAIYDYICKNVTYDHNPNGDKRKHSVYAALTGEKNRFATELRHYFIVWLWKPVWMPGILTGEGGRVINGPCGMPGISSELMENIILRMLPGIYKKIRKITSGS